MGNEQHPLRQLPQVQRLLESPSARGLIARYGHTAVVGAIRGVLAEVRESIRQEPARAVPDHGSIMDAVAGHLETLCRCGLRRTINATGVVLHTNLGRAPLAMEAIANMAEVAGGYCNLESDLETGKRGSRTEAIEPLLCDLAGAEASLVVNNGAAAVLLALSALSEGGEVIVSRGELVEIGGGFRIPDVIQQGGARLVEVGSTNKTRIEDYRAAIGPETRVLLKVHQSNFRMVGFTRQTGIEELAELAREHGLLTVADLGSGLLRRAPGLEEPTLGDALAAGADLVTCSGDKLLGGPQAGLIAGRRAALDPLRRHPLLRAVRLDKLSLTALETTLMLHRDAPDRIPVLNMLNQSAAVLQERAERLQQLLGAGEIQVTTAYAGGGSIPGDRIASRALALPLKCSVEEAAYRLRTGIPPVIGRVNDGRLLIDLLAVADRELPELATALGAVLG